MKTTATKHYRSEFVKPSADIVRKAQAGIAGITRDLGLTIDGVTPNVVKHAVEHMVEQKLTLRDFVTATRTPITPKQVKHGRLSYVCPVSWMVIIIDPTSGTVFSIFKLADWKINKFYSEYL